jgi:hypothetical protein
VPTGAFVAVRDGVAFPTGNSGFPKSLDVSKAIDKAAGAEREVVGISSVTGHRHSVGSEKYGGGNGIPQSVNLTTAPATPEAQQWSGWGTALKPALEPITVARKPLDGTVAANVLEHGTGGLNVDGCRVGTEEILGRAKGGWGNKAVGADNYGNFNSIGITKEGGRWPANLIHDGSEEVVGLFPVTKSGKMLPTHTTAARSVYGQNASPGYVTIETYGDSGSAARFFYCAKASKQDRDGGCEGLEERKVRRYGEQGQGPSPQQTPRTAVSNRNHHPTVKPTDLMRYLCRLVTPPGGVVLDPFTGSGSTGRGAVLEGFAFVGCELDPEYAEIARARIAHAVTEREEERAEEARASAQTTLFGLTDKQET